MLFSGIGSALLAFGPPHRAHAVPGCRSARGAWTVKMDAAATIAAAGWKVLMPELEQVPVFVCANAAGQPLRYERDGRPLALFYADISQAKQELADRRRSYPELELRLLPIGLGSAFTRAGAGAAVIVPSPEELTNAADPEAGA